METGQEDDKLPKASSTWRVEEGANLEDLPELISEAAEPSQEVTDEEGLGHAAAPQDQQALRQDLRSRELRNTKANMWSAGDPDLHCCSRQL